VARAALCTTVSTTTAAATTTTTTTIIHRRLYNPVPSTLALWQGQKQYFSPTTRGYFTVVKMKCKSKKSTMKIIWKPTSPVLLEEDFGSFVRRPTISNFHAKQPITLSILDGLAKMQPDGGDIGFLLKTMGRTLEGFMYVFFPYNNSITMPFFQLTTKLGDSDFVRIQNHGHYCFSILEGKDGPRRHLLPFMKRDSGHITGPTIWTSSSLTLLSFLTKRKLFCLM
jgi:hypothetical protein